MVLKSSYIRHFICSTKLLQKIVVCKLFQL
nr:MAG TPA: hypothetical protein [Caudoviricetes sp.]DAW78866.1 MAG TPA: hypothetical protein [Caudoviricetes sp.]